MSNYQRLICASLLLAGVGVAGNARAADNPRAVAVEINRANELLRKGDVDAAIEAYQKMQPDAPYRSDLSYDMAVAQYRKGDVAAAQHLFQSVAASDNDGLAAKARYNLGNCDYAAALKVSKSDAPTAIKGLDHAITNYRSALDIDPTDADARTNLELAARLRDKLRQQQKEQQKQQQQQQQQDQKQNKKDQQSQSKQQQQQQKQNKKNDNQPSQPNQKQQQQRQSSADKQQQQQKSAEKNQQQNQQQKKNEQSQQNKSSAQQKQNEKNGSEKKQQQQAKPNEQEKPQQKKPENGSSDATQQQQQKQQQQQPNPSSQRQSPQTLHQHQTKNPADEKPEPTEQQGKQAPKGKLATASKPDKSKNAQNKQDSIDPDSASDSPMTRQEAEKMLQAIRDRDMLRRLQRQAAERDQHVPVDRDW